MLMNGMKSALYIDELGVTLSLEVENEPCLVSPVPDVVHVAGV
jgi:hypothetical protein